MNLLRALVIGSPLPVGLALVGLASLHRLQLDGPDYVHGPVQTAVVVALLAQLILLAPQPVVWGVLIIRRQWRWLLASIVLGAVGLGLFVAAFIIDAPTLLYAT